MGLLQDFAVVLVFAGIAGLLFRRFGLSAIVGYLIAGMIIGPHTPPFSLVGDVERVHTLSQFGLVFLMFFVGLELSLSRIRTLGFSLVWATALLSWLVFNLCQFFAYMMGWNQVSSFVFASMFVVSSSAIISKMLIEGRLSHERYAQNALGITILEDVVVIILLTLLSSQVHISAGDHGDITGGPGKVLGLFAGFVVLSVVIGILFLPRLLKRFNRTGDMDLKVIIVAGLVFSAAVVTGKVGFSPALGAFLFGVVVSGTSFKHKIEKSLMGTQDIFSAVFFASIGMLIDIKTVHHHLWLVLGVTAFIVPIRIFAASLSFLVTGSEFKTAIRTALILTPIGEFSYILAQAGVGAPGSGVPDYFYVIAVGSSILTSIISPFLVRHADIIADFTANRQPAFLRKSLGAYQVWLQEIVRKQDRIFWWKLTSKRLGQLSIELLLLAGVLIYSVTIQQGIKQLLVDLNLDFSFSPYLYWLVIGVVCLVLFVAIWRNIGALSMIYSEACAGREAQARRLRPVIELAIQTVGTVGLLWMVWMLFPVQLNGPWAGITVFVIAVIFVALFWRKLIHWYSHFQYSLNQALSGPSPSISSMVTPQQSEFWRVQLAECVLPDHASCRMKTIAELGLRPKFGCTIVEIERHGALITNPSPDTLLFSGDKLLLFGANNQIKPALDFLQSEDEPVQSASSISESQLETIGVLPESARIGHSLADLQIFAKTGMQVLGIEREGQSTLNPAANHQLKAGDKLLVLGSKQQAKKFRQWLNEQS
ncbi:MAG: cation:proton antiporter [Verrucomicrobiales bacterium]|jgi:CPA2 family monovalent cation:H+ antiporter-2|nr:cation:proton antiporter [Verrucomicrobiales bacterium]